MGIDTVLLVAGGIALFCFVSLGAMTWFVASHTKHECGDDDEENNETAFQE
ncbi:MAG: hypothetical protein QG653_556 [Patescibacteria group bacterium]|nr:hypothetical protein [Patescibacteria group bacterium]